MKEIVVISGKGGTGKTSITASFAYLAGKEAIVADCDVDAADMHLLLDPDFSEAVSFFSGEKAVIDPDKCTQCGKCADVCRFDAVFLRDQNHAIEPLSCEGCGYCARVCPANAISNHEQNVGNWYTSRIKTGSTMVHAKLGIGADNSGKLVARVKKEAQRIAEEQEVAWILVDGSPGIGCPVISSLTGAHFVVLVTEPTISGYHDLQRVYTLVKKFNIRAGCIINKSDINLQVTKITEEFLHREKIVHLSNLPYDESFTRAMTAGQTIIEYSKNNLKDLITGNWNKIKQVLA